MYTDNALELVAAVSRLKLKHDTSTPYRSIANSIAERSIRIVTEGTRTLLKQWGFYYQRPFLRLDDALRTQRVANPLATQHNPLPISKAIKNRKASDYVRPIRLLRVRPFGRWSPGLLNEVRGNVSFDKGEIRVSPRLDASTPRLLNDLRGKSIADAPGMIPSCYVRTYVPCGVSS